MSLFVCDTPDCRRIDNTALTLFNIRRNGPAKCALCQFGKQHGRFEPSVYNPEAPIGSNENPEAVWADGEWRNMPPRRLGHHGPDGWAYDDGFGPTRPYTWIDGKWYWNDELPQPEAQV